MSVLARFDILGTPVQQGSKRGFNRGGRVQLVEDAGPRHKAWRATVADRAREIADADPLAPYTGPLFVTIDFRFTMPAKRSAATLRAGIAWKSTTPDIDKLERALYDGLKVGGLIHDDAIIAMHLVRKLEVTGNGAWLGAHVVIQPLTGTPLP